MAAEEKDEPVFCPHCGVILPDHVPVQVVIDQAKELSRRQGIITRLVNEAEEKKKAKQDGAQIQRVVTHWRTACNHPKTVVEVGGKIATCVWDRIDGGFTVEQLCRAIDGYATYPYVGSKGRQRTNENGGRRFDGLELICRNDDQVGKGLALADRADTEGTPLEN